MWEHRLPQTAHLGWTRNISEEPRLPVRTSHFASKANLSLSGRRGRWLPASVCVHAVIVRHQRPHTGRDASPHRHLHHSPVSFT